MPKIKHADFRLLATHSDIGEPDLSSCINPMIVSVVLASLLPLAAPAFAQVSPDQFVSKAANSERFEIEAAKVALEKGNDQSAKEFAQDMLDDHSRSLAELEKAAQAEQVTVPSTLDAESNTKLQALKDAPSSDFDQAYLSTQLAVHEEAVQHFMAYSKDGKDGELRNYASQAVATLRTHNLRIHGLTHR